MLMELRNMAFVKLVKVPRGKGFTVPANQWEKGVVAGERGSDVEGAKFD